MQALGCGHTLQQLARKHLSACMSMGYTTATNHLEPKMLRICRLLLEWAMLLHVRTLLKASAPVLSFICCPAMILGMPWTMC